ncbi:MAG: ribosome silencing factor [Armatimonadota bacterium]
MKKDYINNLEAAINTKNELKSITKILKDKKAKDITVVDLTSKSILCDYFVIVTATSKTHSKSLVENISIELKKEKIYPQSIQGLREAGWIIMDYGSIVVHVFTDGKREFYNLEELWK